MGRSRLFPPDNPGMPAVRGRYHDRSLLLGSECRQGLGLGMRQCCQFNRLPLPIEAIELTCKACTFGWIILEQQLYAERGAPNPAARVDARS